jgi:predicted tellurium resistance membrane protein TerC
MLEFLSDPGMWVSLATLTVLEIVLGIDNIIFITILAANLPKELRKRAQFIGLSMALVTRVAMLFFAFWIIQLEEDILHIGDFGFSGRDMILIAGGIFLVYKSTTEIHEKLEGAEGSDNVKTGGSRAFVAIIGQILVLDIVFSIDGIITAVGMTDSLAVMIIAVVISSIVMLLAAGVVGDFVDKHPTVKMLALAFLVLIGAALVAEGFGTEIDKAFIYGPMAFSVIVEALNITYKNRQAKRVHHGTPPVHLRDAITEKPKAKPAATTSRGKSTTVKTAPKKPGATK